jgi:predicted nucleic acid-binding protein
MKYIFDTSIFIAAFIKNHPNHIKASSWFQKALNNEFDSYISAHSIIEIYSVLTRAPFQPRISPDIANKLIDHNIKNNITPVTLNRNDYFSLIEYMTKLDLSGGIIYDAIVVQCARKESIEHIVTFNKNDFLKLIPDKSIYIVSP